MSKDKAGTEPNFDTALERINVDSKALLIKTPFDNLKIKKNLDQLYHILKRKNEEEKTIPEELRARNIFRLSQLGIECSKISQALIHEQYFINKKKEEKETQSTSQFATTLGEDYDVNSYIQKYTDFMLFNLTDHAYIQGKTRTQKQVVNKLSELWANDVKKLVESKKVQSDNLAVGTRLISQGPRAAIKRKSKGIDEKKARYFNSLNKYMSLKYTGKDRNAVLVSGMISEFAAFTLHDQEVCELWKILGYQVDAFEKASIETQNANSNVLGTSSFDEDANEGRKSLSYIYRCYQEIISVTCKVLEEEFQTQIISQTKGTTSYIQHHDGGVSEEDRNFIIQEYMEPGFRNRNYIEFDDKSYPVWAMCYVLFRTGRLNQLQNFLVRYDGSLKGELIRFNQFLTKYRDSMGELDSELKQDVLQSLDSGEQNIDVFKKMLYFILAKSEEIPSEDLVARLGDYLWFNLKICSPIQEDLSNRKGLKLHNTSLSLFDIQKRILGYGSEHFNPGNSVPLNYVKTLFILQAYDEALHFLRNYESYYEEFIHFAIALNESGLITLRWDYTELNNKFKFELFKDNDYCREVIEYATSFCEKNPLEACLYLRLLWPDKDGSGEHMKKKNLIIETISNFIISNDQVSMFFDKTREAQKNAGYLEDIVGSELYREVILAITKHYRKSKLQVALVLLDKIEFYEEVLELILEEEYESLKKFKERSKGRDLTTAKSPYESFFNDILDRYGRKNILNKNRFVYTAYEFVRKVKALWENYAKKNYNDAFELLRKWDHEWYIFGYDENEILEEFTANHEIVQKCYLDLLLISSKIIKEYTNYLRLSQKSQDHINMKLKEVNALWRKLCDFYRKVKRKFSSDAKNTQTLKELDNEIEIVSTF